MIKLDYNKSYRRGKLHCDEATLMDIRRHFSEKVEGIEFIRKKANNDRIPSRTYAIQKTGMFDFGIYEEIEQYFVEKQITGVEYTDTFKERRDNGFDYEFHDDLAFKNRDYGVDAVKSCLSKGYGTILSATGSGKSFLTASLIENLKRNNTFEDMKVLILVPGVGLVDQLTKDFESYGVSFTHSGWTGDIRLQNTEVIICNTENFCAKFKENASWIKKVDVLIADECHKVKNGNIVTGNIKRINTEHKYGFTGTLPPSKIDKWKVIGLFGPVVFEKHSKELRDQGYLTNAKVKRVKMNHRLMRRMSYKNELNYVYNCEIRNKKIAKICDKLNNNALILVNHLEHGENIKAALEKYTDKKVYFVSGEMDVDSRAAVIESMENGDDILCVAMSSIFSTGINIKNLHYLLFVAGGKSFVRTVQSIGRGLRLHDSKEFFVIIDVYDDLEYSLSHAESRKEIYESEDIPWKEVEIDL
jgi:superfamily II DNA or RNA helicase